MDRCISQSCPTCRRARAPHHERGSNRHQFPEDEDREKVAGEDDANGAASITEGRGKFDHPILVERKQAAGERHDCEHGCKQTGKCIASNKR